MKALTIIASVALCSSTYASVLWVDNANNVGYVRAVGGDYFEPLAVYEHAT